MFSVIRLEGYINFFLGKVLQVFYFPSTTVVKTENLVAVFGKFLILFCAPSFCSNLDKEMRPG